MYHTHMPHSSSLLAYGVLAGGTLSGKYQDGAKPAKSRHTDFPGGCEGGSSFRFQRGGSFVRSRVSGVNRGRVGQSGVHGGSHSLTTRKPSCRASCTNELAVCRTCLLAEFQSRYHNPRTLAAAAEYAALAKRVGLSPATLAQAWAASRWYMGSGEPRCCRRAVVVVVVVVVAW
jgi:aryl-alcohol dehydrogenase-like predicted oxidoreductase